MALDTPVRGYGWSADDLNRLADLIEEHGTAWPKIQQHFPRRSLQDIRNKYYRGGVGCALRTSARSGRFPAVWPEAVVKTYSKLVSMSATKFTRSPVRTVRPAGGRA